MWQVVLFNVTNGLIIGAFYVLMALGLALILNLSNVINFAHGNFLALGGYLAFTLSPALGYWGALLISPLLTALIGIAVERGDGAQVENFDFDSVFFQNFRGFERGVDHGGVGDHT